MRQNTTSECFGNIILILFKNIYENGTEQCILSMFKRQLSKSMSLSTSFIQFILSSYYLSCVYKNVQVIIFCIVYIQISDRYYVMARNILKLGALEAQKTAFLLCDIQETFRPHIKHFGEVVKVANKMVGIYS